MLVQTKTVRNTFRISVRI